MDITCPACQYVRKDGEHSEVPDWRCPQCEVVYEKYEKNLNKANGVEPETVSQEATKPTDKPIIMSDQTAPKKIWREDDPVINSLRTAKGILILLIVFIAGFFAGREYFKYEIRTTISDTFSRAPKPFIPFTDSSKVKTESEKVEVPAPKLSQNYLPAEISEKSFREFDSKIGNSAITFTLFIKNPFEKNIRAFNGVVIFKDILDNEIKRLNLAFKDSINAYDTVQWRGEADYNQFIDSSRDLRNADVNDIKIHIELKKVIFDDGEVIDL